MILLAGVDVGSTGLKVALYVPDGRRVGYAYREYAIDYGPNGQATLNPMIWWQSLQSCFKELSAQFELKQVACLGISSANAISLMNTFPPYFRPLCSLTSAGRRWSPR